MEQSVSLATMRDFGTRVGVISESPDLLRQQPL